MIYECNMILRVVCIFCVMVLNAETLPIRNMHLHPVSMHSADRNFQQPHSISTPSLRPQVSGSLRTFFGHPNLPLRQPAPESFDVANRMTQKIDGLIPSRSSTPFSDFFHQYLSKDHQEKAEKVRLFGQKVRDTFRYYENHHDQRMQHIKELLNQKIKLNDIKDRLKQALFKNKSLMHKLHSMGGRGKYVGVPYHTMNDDHMIVKKPGAYFYSYSQPNIGTPILVPVRPIQPPHNIHSISTEHPVALGVTTSVYLNEESEAPATVAGYVLPITRIATYSPEVIAPLETMNPIDQEKLTTLKPPLDSSSHTGVIMSTDPTTENAIWEANTSTIPVDATIESTKNDHLSSIIRTESTIAEIISTVPSILPNATTFESGITSVYTPAIEATTIGSKVFEIMVTELPNPLMDPESTSETISTISSKISIERAMTTDEISTIDATSGPSTIEKDMTAEIDWTGPSTILPDIGSWQMTTGVDLIFPSTMQIETTTMVNERLTSSPIDPAFENPAIATESTEIFDSSPLELSTETITTLEGIFTSTDSSYDNFEIDSRFSSTFREEATAFATENWLTIDMDLIYPTIEIQGPLESLSVFPFTFPISTTTVSKEISTTDNPVHNSFAHDEITTTEIGFTLSNSISQESTSWLLPASEITSLWDVLSTFEYPNSTDQVDITSGVGSTFPSTVITETDAMVDESWRTVGLDFDHSIIDIESTTEMFSSSPSTISPETITNLEGPFTTIGSDSSTPTIDEESHMNGFPLFSSTVSTQATMLSNLDVFNRFGYNNFSDSTVVTEITTRDDVALLSTNPTQPAMVPIERLTTVDLAHDGSKFDMGITTGNIAALTSTILTKTPRTPDERYKAVDPTSRSFSSDGNTTLETIYTPSNTISLETTSWRPPALGITPFVDVLPGFSFSTMPTFIDTTEKTTELYSTFPFMISAEITTMATERLTTVDTDFNYPAIELERSIEDVSIFPLTLSSEETIFSAEIFTTTDSAYNGFANDGDTETEIASTQSNSISLDSIPWPSLAFEITSSKDGISAFEYNPSTDSIDILKTTAKIDSTFPFTIATDKNSTETESWTKFDHSTIKIETIETFSSPSSTLPEKTTVVAETIKAIDYNVEITEDTLSNFAPTVSTETTMSPDFEIVTSMDVLPGFRSNHFTGSTIAPDSTSGVESIFFLTIPAETLTMVAETSTPPASVKSTIDMESMLPSTILTEATPNSEVISATTDLYFDSLTNTDGTTTPMILTSSATTPTMAISILEEVSETTDLAPSRFSDDSEITTEIFSTLHNRIPTETTILSVDEYGTAAEHDFAFLKGKQANSDERVDRLLFTHTSEEDLDAKTLLNLIPIIIEELRKNNVTPEEEYTFSQVFGDLWPLFKEESTHKDGELMNPKLASFLFEAGQQISDIENPIKNAGTDNLDSKSESRIGTNFNNIKTGI